MGQFSESISQWRDSDGLIGSSPNPQKWSSGNQLLETSIACVYEVLLNGRSADIDFLRSSQSAIAACQDSDGSFDKNPGRPDQITHDDLKAIAAMSRICSMPFARAICDFGDAHNWMLSNTGVPYWEAYAKPWDKAQYMLCASRKPAWYEMALSDLSIVDDAFFGDVSSNRITWLLATALVGVDPYLDLCFSIWRRQMRKRYPSIGHMMYAYYGADPKNQAQALLHPYVIYGRALTF